MKTEINHAQCFDIGLARSKLPKNVNSSCCQYYYYGYTCRAALGKFMSALFTISKPFGMTQGMYITHIHVHHIQHVSVRP